MKLIRLSEELFEGKKIKRKHWDNDMYLSRENSFAISNWLEYDDFEVIELPKYHVV